MSDFTPNSGDSAPQGTPFVPQDGEYRTSQYEQQLPMPLTMSFQEKTSLRDQSLRGSQLSPFWR